VRDAARAVLVEFLQAADGEKGDRDRRHSALASAASFTRRISMSGARPGAWERPPRSAEGRIGSCRSTQADAHAGNGVSRVEDREGLDVTVAAEVEPVGESLVLAQPAQNLGLI
jgi:hypothetical protein